MNFFEEIKRRKVLKTLGVYAAAAFIIIQVSDIVFPQLLFPEWTVRFVIILVILGFPLTFFLSWNYNITQDNQKQSENSKQSKSITDEVEPLDKSNLNIYTITGAVLACIGIGFWFFFSTSSLTSGNENIIENSIAVFSFEVRTPEDKKSTIGVILQDLIISDLSGLTHLNVISSQRLFDIQKQMAENKDDKYAIAQQANAKVLLAGTIMNRDNGQKILIGNLIDAINGNVIISHRIEGTDIYPMVDDLTEHIRKDLEISTHKDDQIALQAGAKTTQSLDAYEKYSEGLKYFNELNYESAEAKFQEAILIDSTFFDAHYLSAISKWWYDESETNQEASDYCKRIIDKKIYNDNDQKLKAEGAYNIIKGNYKDALPIFEKIVKLYPDDKASWYMYGEATYHIEKKGDEETEKYYGQADAAFRKALELDPKFSVARIHIIDMMFFSKKYHDVIIEEKKNLIINEKNFLSYANIIRSYEILEDSTNAIEYLNKAKLYLGDGGLCDLYIYTGWGLGMSRQQMNLINQTNYHLRKSVQYLMQGLSICSDDKIHPTEGNSPHFDPLPVILSYRAYDGEYAENLYKEITMKQSDNDKMKYAYRVGTYNSWDNIERQFPNEDTIYRFDFTIKYLLKALEYAKKLNNKEYFTKSSAHIINSYSELGKSEKAETFFKEELTSFCGSDNNISCLLSDGAGLGILANVFYQMNNYEYATKIYQHLTDHANLISLEGSEKEMTLAYLHEIHYRLGLMNMKTDKYYVARQNFISAANALKEHIILIEKVNRQNWVNTEMINERIGECYYRENNFVNAIQYYNEAYKLETHSTDKIEILSILALSEYYNNQFDSSKVHFEEVEKYYSKEDINYNRSTPYTYIDFPLYKYYHAKGNILKAQQYLTDAYNHIPENERTEYIKDDTRMEHLHKYYYIHEIIETYNQSIR